MVMNYYRRTYVQIYTSPRENFAVVLRDFLILTDDNRITTPVLNLSLVNESQELTTGLHEPRPVAARRNPWRYKTIGSVFSGDRERRNVSPPCIWPWPARFELPFSTSKFDVGQINTLRPATFEVARVDSGRPVNIGAIVPQRVAVVGTFWAQGTRGRFPSSPRCPLRAAGDFWTFLSFVKIEIILRAFHESIAASQRTLLSPFVSSSIPSFIRGRIVSLLTISLSLALATLTDILREIGE